MFRSYVCVRQHDITDCGAACLATVARAHKLKIPVATLRQYAGTDRRGTNVLGMVEAAQHLGFEARGVRGTPDALPRVPVPCIAHVVSGDLHHYVVIHKVTDKYLIIADPARGVVKETRKRFIGAWSGVLVILMPGATFRAGDRTVSVWGRFARLLEPHDFLLAETFLASLFFLLLGLGFSVYVQLLVDRVLVEKNWALLRWLSLGLIGTVGCRAALGAVRGVLLAHVGRRLDLSLMLEYYRHVMWLPMQFFETRQTGEIISRLGDAVKIREALSGSTLTLLVDTAVMAAALGTLCFYSWELALISFAVLPALALTVRLVNGPLRRAQREAMEAAAGVHAHLVEIFTGAGTIKALGAEEAAGLRTENRIVGMLGSLFRATAWGLSSGVAGELITGLGLVAVVWAAASMALRGRLTAGELVACYSILLYVLQPMLRLATLNQGVQDALVAADRLGEVLDLEGEFAAEGGKLAPPAGGPGGDYFQGSELRLWERGAGAA